VIRPDWLIFTARPAGGDGRWIANIQWGWSISPPAYLRCISVVPPALAGSCCRWSFDGLNIVL